MSVSYLACFYLTFLLYLVLFFPALRGDRRSPQFYKLGLSLPVIVNGITLAVMTVQSGHLPMRYLFEVFVELAFALAVLTWIMCFFRDIRSIIRYILFMIVLLFGVSLFSKMQLSLRIYRYSLLMAQLFFQLEVVAFAFMLFSVAWFFSRLIEKKTAGEGRFLLEQGRLFLLIGFIFFLASQFFGSLWSLQGWGDYWMWGKMAFAGVVVWAYAMFLLHIRYVSFCRETYEAAAGSLLFLVILGYRIAWQP
jgi:hypothetical protein